MGRPSVTHVLRAFVAVLLLVGFYTLGIGLIAGLGWLGVWMWMVFPGEQAFALTGVFMMTAVALGVPVWQAMRTRPEPPALGVPVTEQASPQLWSLVRELAEAVQTRPPDEIQLLHEVNAAVWEDTRLLGLRAGRRYLYLGVPLLRLYSVAEIRAVIAHELGHYSYRHTRLAVVVYRGGVAMIDTVDQAGRRNPVGWVLAGYAAIYFLVALAVMRRTELEADRAAVRLAGRRATASLLRSGRDLGVDWEAFLSRYARRALRHRGDPAELLSSFDFFVPDPGEREVVQRRRPAVPSAWDSHPPDSTRVAAVRGEPEPAVPPDERPGRVLVSDPEVMHAALRTAQFDRHVEWLMQLQAERWAGRLRNNAARVLRRRQAHLGDVLDLLADGRAADLGRALGLAEDGEELVEYVVVAASGVLVDTGRAYWRHSMGELLALVAVDGDEPVALRHPVELACSDPGRVAQVRALLRNLGVTQEWHLTGRDPAAEPPLDPGFGPDAALLLPDQIVLLMGWRAGSGAGHAALAASVLAELRLRDRIELALTSEATVIVRDATGTGDGLLDSVLERIAESPRQPAYRWVNALARDVGRTMRHRTPHQDWPPELREQVRAGILRAISEGDEHGREIVLGSMLWGGELAGSVLGWRAPVARFWLGRLAARDPLAVAVRIVIGLNFRPPTGPLGSETGGSGGGGGGGDGDGG